MSIFFTSLKKYRLLVLVVEVPPAVSVFLSQRFQQRLKTFHLDPLAASSRVYVLIHANKVFYTELPSSSLLDVLLRLGVSVFCGIVLRSHKMAVHHSVPWSAYLVDWTRQGGPAGLPSVEFEQNLHYMYAAQSPRAVSSLEASPKQRL